MSPSFRLLALFLAFFVVETSAVAQVQSEEAPQASPQDALVQKADRFLQQNNPKEVLPLLADLLANGDETDLAYQNAQFLTAVALVKLNLPLSASYAFSDIAEAGETHARYYETIDWFLRIQRDMPGDEESLTRLAEYDPTLYPPAESNEILYLVGRHYYLEEDFEIALESFESVEQDGGIFYIKSQFFIGVIQTRQNQAQPALEAFKNILRYQRDVADSEEITRIANKAVLSLGRLFYTVGKFDTSIRYYDQIQRENAAWLDSLFESSWAYYKMENYNRAMGNLHSLNSPFFEDSYQPEALILQAVILLKNCQFKESKTAVERFIRIYKPLHEELEAQLKQTSDPNSFYRYLATLSQQDKKAGLSIALKRVFNAALQDARLRRLLRYVIDLNKETNRIDGIMKSMKNGPARDFMSTTASVLASYRDLIVSDAGEAAMQRLDRVYRELGSLLSQALRIKFEILQSERRMLGVAKRLSAAEVKAQQDQEVPPPLTDEEHQYWPFDGEYWKDELGSYTTVIPSRCLKAKK